MAGAPFSVGRLWPVLPPAPDDEATPAGLAPGQPPVNPRRDGMIQPTAAGKDLGRGIGAVAEHVARGLADPFVLGHDVYYGKTDPMSDEGIGRAFGLATTLATGGMPMAEPGALGIFGGRMSRTANKEALAEAQEQAAMGIGRKDIWNETGWFQGSDNKWRYEIPDDATRYSGQGPKLGHGLDHPEAYKAYPDLKATDFARQDALADDALGLYHYKWGGSPERIEVARTYAGEPIPKAQQHDTALHEAQHAIQVREGTLSSSASRELSPEDYINDLKERVANGYRLKGNEGTPEAYQRWKDTQYWQSPHEVEARNVEKRRTWSDAERRSVPPWDSADVSWPQPAARDAYPAGALAGAGLTGAAALASPNTAEAASSPGVPTMAASARPFSFMPTTDEYGRPLFGMGTGADTPAPATAPPRTPGAEAPTAPPMVAPFSFAGLPASSSMEIGGPGGFGPGSAGAGLPLPSGGGAVAGAGPVASTPRAMPMSRASVLSSPQAAALDSAPLPPPRPTEFGGTGTWEQPGTAAPTAPATGAADGSPIWDAFRKGLRENGDMLGALGVGLMSTRGVGPGIAAGWKNYQDSADKKVVTDLAKAKTLAELQKVGQVQAGYNATVEGLVRKGISREDALTAVAASQAGSKDALQNLMNTAFPKKAETPFGWQPNGSGGVQPLPGGPQDPATLRVQAQAKQDDSKAPTVRSFTLADGTKVDRTFNPQTGAWEAPTYGASPPVAQAEDTTGIPPGVDPDTYRKELAKKTVAQQASATDRAAQAGNVLPILDRAEKAYRALGEASAIGPLNASTVNRTIGGVFGVNNEKLRQEYEAAAKDLELYKAQISMKGQGAITEGERRLLALTLPRLDAADPQTGLTTLQSLREQFTRAQQADRLPSYELNAQGRPRGGERFQQQQLQRRQSSRFNELVGQGMSKEDAFAKMRDEGL